MHLPTSLLVFSLCSSSHVLAAVTVHYQDGQQPVPTSSTSSYNGNQAYNPVSLSPPPLPSPPPPLNFSIQLNNNPSPTQNLSIPQSGAFFGFSIELAAVSQIIGKNGTILQVPFLNLLSNIQQRSGHVNVRLGGTSIDFASLVEDLGSQTEAILYGSADPPPLVFTTGLLYMLSNVSSLVNTRWYLGIPFNTTNRFRLAMAEYGQGILGDNLVGLQVGEQPDTYASGGIRPYNYSPNDYKSEFGSLIAAMQNGSTPIGDLATDDVTIAIASNNTFERASKLLIGPNVISGTWTPEQVWNSGFVDDYKTNIAAISVEHYAANNCFSRKGTGLNVSAQDLFPTFLNHTAAISLVQPYINSAHVARQAGKPLLMMETNSASCGGFPGLSDSFGAALWAIDYALQMAYANFSGAMFHNVGQNSSFNAFTPAPNTQGSTLQWTIGPIYYSALVMAEVLGPSGRSRVLDLGANDDNISVFTPAYAIYDGASKLSKVALFNYLSDPSGQSTTEVSVGIGEGMADLVSVKYLTASSVSQKGNFTWAGQTFGGYYGSDGVPQGTEDIQTVSCADQVCKIRVPAPGFALVFLTNEGLAAVEGDPTEPLSEGSGTSSLTAMGAGASGGSNLGVTKTFGTTVVTIETLGTTADPSAVATSNGERGGLGSTTKGKDNGAIGSSCGRSKGLTLSVVVVLCLLVMY